jgi:RNA polymerase sigma factor (sigma-70 family)
MSDLTEISAHAEAEKGAMSGPLASGESSVRLLRRAKSGDLLALDLLYRRYLPPLQRWARGRLPHWARSVADTDDLVQETLLGSLRGISAFERRHAGAFQAYLRQGVLNRLRDEIRRVRRHPEAAVEVGEAADPRPSPIEEAIGREVLARYESAMQRLRPEDRGLVAARVELGFTYEQMATAHGKNSADAARIATSRALARLAKEMARADADR